MWWMDAIIVSSMLAMMPDSFARYTLTSTTSIMSCWIGPTTGTVIYPPKMRSRRISREVEKTTNPSLKIGVDLFSWDLLVDSKWSFDKPAHTHIYSY